MKYNIYIGYDSSNYGQHLANVVCIRSILQTTNIPLDDLNIYSLVLKDLKKQKLYYRNEDKLASTEFTYTRFLVPYLNDYKGWALFCDSDFLYRDDIKNVFDYIHKNNNHKKAVLCVKHPLNFQKAGVKMDGRVQSAYPRKNWSSLMLFNCEHPDTKNLTLENANTQSPKWLHRMLWTTTKNIGTLPPKFNFLVENYKSGEIDKVDKKLDFVVEKPMVLHWTDGGPWHHDYIDTPYQHLWINYLTPSELQKLDNELIDYSTNKHKTKKKLDQRYNNFTLKKKIMNLL